MSKAPKLLRFLVLPPLHEDEVWKGLIAQGHVVTFALPEVMAIPDQYDVIVGPNCWRMTGEMMKYLPQAIKQARLTKYPKKGKNDES